PEIVRMRLDDAGFGERANDVQELHGLDEGVVSTHEGACEVVDDARDHRALEAHGPLRAVFAGRLGERAEKNAVGRVEATPSGGDCLRHGTALADDDEAAGWLTFHTRRERIGEERAE